MCGVIRSVQGIVCKLSICTCCLHGLPRLGDFKISWKRAEAVLQFWSSSPDAPHKPSFWEELLGSSGNVSNLHLYHVDAGSRANTLESSQQALSYAHAARCYFRSYPTSEGLHKLLIAPVCSCKLGLCARKQCISPSLSKCLRHGKKGTCV